MMREREDNTMSPDGTYNGYANYQTWNVVLWIDNDENLYSLAQKCDSYNHFKQLLRDIFTSGLAFETPDGVSWNDSAVNLAEVEEFWTENFSKVAY
jgi:hypothetical protein